MIKNVELFKDKKILVLGFGREGMDNLNFLRKNFPEKAVGIADKLDLDGFGKEAKQILKKDKRLKLHLGQDYLKSLKDYEVIIKSPGISPFSIKPFLKNQIVTSQTEIFFDLCLGTIVGITGTKGKSTTTSLIHKVLKDNGFKAFLVGNIGKPVLSLLEKQRKDHVFVYELSCHQLLGLEKSPHIAVFLNIFPEHLDYYKSLKDYVASKASITLHQTENDYLIFNSENELVANIASKSKAEKIPLKSIKIGKIKTKLMGDFNSEKIKAAFMVGKLFGIKEKDIISSIEKFKPLPHRLEYVGEYKDIRFFNDSLSTIPEATIAALDTLGSDVKTLILGGLDRGISFTNLAKRINKSRIKTLILFPTTGEKIWLEMLHQSQKSSHKVFLVQNMKDAVKLCFQYTPKGKICLLSTASPSFTIFKDYKEKGNLFKKYVREYGKDN